VHVLVVAVLSVAHPVLVDDVDDGGDLARGRTILKDGHGANRNKLVERLKGNKDEFKTRKSESSEVAKLQ
jgi:hypothetical protein